MGWRIEISASVERELDAIGSVAARRVLTFLGKRVGSLENPRNVGQALRGSKLGDFWKYRVGDYRIIASLKDETMTVLVVRIGNRRDVYKR